MRRSTVFGILAGVLVLGLAGYFTYRTFFAGSTPATTTQTAQVERGTLVTTVSAAGNIAARQTATVSWRARGTVGRVNVAVGQVVQAGQVLAELDPDNPDPSMLQARADLLAAQEALATLQAGPTSQQLAQARLAVVQAQDAVTSAQKSLNYLLNPVSQALLDQAEDARVALQSAQSSLQLLNASPDIAALQNQTFLTNWYRSRLSQMQEAAKGNEGNPDVADALRRAQIDYQAQLDKQYTLQLQIDTNRANKSNDVRNAQLAYNQAAANLQAAQSGPNAARVTLAQAQLALAQANLEKAADDLATLEAGPDAQALAAAQARLATAQAAVDAAQLTAPISGTVIAVNHQPGDSVEANQAAVVLADLSSLEVAVSVAEVDVNQIQPGQTANLTVDAVQGQTFAGQVSVVALAGSAQQGVVNFPVTVVISSPDPGLKPGMTAAVAIVTQQHPGVLMVPNRALHTSGGQRTVIVLFEGQQVPVPVTVGLSNETYSEVSSDSLREGDTLVLNAAASSSTRTLTNGGMMGPGFGGGGAFPP